MIRVIVADDQPLMRSALAVMIESQADLRLVAEASDGNELLSVAHEHPADIVLMDIRMPNLDGIAATRRVLSAHPQLRVIVLTTYDLDEYVVAAIRAGASGFLLKDASTDELVRAIRAVHAGDSALAPTAVAALMAIVGRSAATFAGESLLDRLTPRERDVLWLLVRGESNETIGATLYLTGNTVKTHVKSILAKVGLPDRVHVLIWAYENGLVVPGR